MKISVNASRRDDILREQAAYNEEMKKQNDVHYQQEAKYEMAQDYNYATVENVIRSKIPQLNSLGVEISIDGYGISRRYKRFRIEFRKEHRGDNSSLRWTWTVELDADGNVNKDSSSWSNIDVTTPEQINDLKQSVVVLEQLVNMDWKPILEQGIAGIPKYTDYVAVHELRSRDAEFNNQLKLAAVEEIIGQQKWIKGGTIEGEGSRWNYGDKWYMINSQTDKFFNVSVMSAYEIERMQEGIKNGSEGYTQEKLEESIKWFAESRQQRVKKEKLLSCLYDRIEIMDMQGSITVENPPKPKEDAEAATAISSGLITL